MDVPDVQFGITDYRNMTGLTRIKFWLEDLEETFVVVHDLEVDGSANLVTSLLL